MSAVLADPLPTAPASTRPIDPARAGRRRQQRLQTLAMVLASYGVDSLMLCLLWAAGAVAPAVPLAYAGAALLSCGVFFVILGSGWTDRLRDHYIVMPHMAVHASINLAFIVWAPQIGVLLLMVLFVIFAFGALRMDLRRVLLGSMAIALAVGAVIVLRGEQLSLPAASWQQRLVCGLWFALILARSSIVGLYGSRLRVLLARRNAQLAATFEQLEHLAHRDELTGSLNRRSIMALLEQERQRMERTGQAFGIALFDIDHFKRVNDGFGHVVGDEVLRRFVVRVAAEMRHTDRLGRYGGEEFLMLLTATTDDAAAQVAAERVRHGVARHDWAAVAPGLAITVSAGVGVCRGGESIEQLLTRTDAALYAAKRAGRNCIRAAPIPSTGAPLSA